MSASNFKFVRILLMNYLALVSLLFSLNIMASDITGPSTTSNLEFHKNKGCPVNSICTQEMGAKLLEWDMAISKVTEKNKTKTLKNLLATEGLPLEFLGKIELQETIKPVMWSSRCKLHSPRNPNRNIYRSMQFLKSIPESDDMIFKHVRLYNGETKVNYRIPIKSYPVLIQDNKLIMTQDYDDLYYQLGVGPTGNLSVENFPYSLIKKALSKNVKDTKCPESMDFDLTYFSKTYCHKIFDMDTNQLKTIQIAWSCP